MGSGNLSEGADEDSDALSEDSTSSETSTVSGVAFSSTFISRLLMFIVSVSIPSKYRMSYQGSQESGKN